MKRTMTIWVAAGMLAEMAGSAIAGGAGADDQLSGKAKSACEAMLCLAATGGVPSECSSALRKYFSIRASKPSKLRKARQNFLNLCPSGSPDLAKSLAQGQCNSNYQDCGASAPVTTPPTTPVAGSNGKQLDLEAIQ